MECYSFNGGNKKTKDKHAVKTYYVFGERKFLRSRQKPRILHKREAWYFIESVLGTAGQMDLC